MLDRAGDVGGGEFAAVARRKGQAVCYRIVDDTIEQLCTIVCGSVARGQRRPQNDAAGVG